MPRPLAYALCTLGLVFLLVLPATAQTVISARSGVIHFFSGSVSLNNQPLDPSPGRFQMLRLGDELSTAKGNAEVLLTPGVLLRLGENSAMRMVSNDLSDTKVELISGSASVSSDVPVEHTSVTLIYKNWKVHFLEKGAYRLDSQPPKLWVDDGKAEVSTEESGTLIPVEQGMDLPLAAVLVPERTASEPSDELSDWSQGRSESVSADNAIASQISDDPAAAADMALDMDLGIDPSQDLGAGSITYFPLLGLPATGQIVPGAGLYGGLYTPQIGFSSIYLPGYTYQPPLIGLLVNRYVSPPVGVRNLYPGIGIGPVMGMGAVPFHHNPLIGPVISPGIPRTYPGARPAVPSVRSAAPHVGGVHR